MVTISLTSLLPSHCLVESSPLWFRSNTLRAPGPCARRTAASESDDLRWPAKCHDRADFIRGAIAAPFGDGARVNTRDGTAIRDEAVVKVTAVEDSEIVLADAA
jgi:hypothetical protein